MTLFRMNSRVRRLVGMRMSTAVAWAGQAAANIKAFGEIRGATPVAPMTPPVDMASDRSTRE
jgi:hypothetical protein